MIVEKIPKKKVSELVVDQLEHMIEEGKFNAGDKLPSIRELCELFDVGRSTIRDAINKLTGKGTVYVKQGEGIFICEFDSAKFFNKTALAPNARNIQELFQVRKILEAGIAKEAAMNHSDADLTKMEHSLSNQIDGWKSDYNFHMAIAHAAGNNILIKFMEFISVTLKKTMNEFHMQIKSNHEVVKIINEQHEKVFQSIKKGHPTTAYEDMINHLTYVEGLLQEHIPKKDERVV